MGTESSVYVMKGTAEHRDIARGPNSCFLFGFFLNFFATSLKSKFWTPPDPDSPGQTLW